LRILLVDDDAPSVEALRDILESEGHLVTTAENGRDAMEILRGADSFCVILLDLMMPVMNGYEFRAEQLKDPKLRSIPVIVLTADGQAREKGAHLMATHIFQKPLSPPDLLSAINQFCQPSLPGLERANAQ
jgi:CheY-like chemotaxis protein